MIQPATLDLYNNLTEFILLIAQLGTIIIGAFIVFYIYVQFHPVMELLIQTEWVGRKKNRELLVTLTIRNASRVKCIKSKVEFQILEYDHEIVALSEWVPFIEDPNNQESIVAWRDPIEICQTTEYWYPGDTLIIQRYYKCMPHKIYKLGLQFQAKLNPLAKITYMWKSHPWNEIEQWTTTRIVRS